MTVLQQRDFGLVSGGDQWEGWSSTPFASSVEEKIEEYRRKKAEPEVTVEKEPESDFFNDMQPKVVQARRVGDAAEFPVFLWSGL